MLRNCSNFSNFSFLSFFTISINLGDGLLITKVSFVISLFCLAAISFNYPNFGINKFKLKVIIGLHLRRNLEMSQNRLRRRRNLPRSFLFHGITTRSKCALTISKEDALVELTLPKDANIYASAYQLCLPDKALLQAKVKKWIAEFEEGEG